MLLFNHSCNFIRSLFVEQLYLIYDHIHRLDFPVYILLAVGAFGFGIISCYLVAHAAFQAAWHSGGRCVQPSEIYYYATWEVVTGGMNLCQGIISQRLH